MRSVGFLFWVVLLTVLLGICWCTCHAADHDPLYWRVGSVDYTLRCPRGWTPTGSTITWGLECLNRECIECRSGDAVGSFGKQPDTTWERIPEQWEVRVTVVWDSCECATIHGSVYVPIVRLDTTYTPKVPVFLTEREVADLMVLLHPDDYKWIHRVTNLIVRDSLIERMRGGSR